MKYPPFLQTNDTIVIVSPSGAIQKELIEGAKRIFECWGYKVEIANNAFAQYGRFAGTPEQRREDLQAALDHPNAKAIFCSRGGYGLTQIIDQLNFDAFCKNPKWLIGFSDITAMHNAISKHNIVSCHASMAKYIVESNENEAHIIAFREFLKGEIKVSTFAAQPQNKTGTAQGVVRGGNLSVLYGLRATPIDINFDGAILFIEDIDEQLYHIDRMMQNLRLSGALSKINALLVGQFNHMPNDPDMMASLEEIIKNACAGYNFPIAFDLPFGHVIENRPLLIGAEAKLIVDEKGASLEYIDF
jgi:muramoyltetrapeptide carboxypeptidase